MNPFLFSNISLDFKIEDSQDVSTQQNRKKLSTSLELIPFYTRGQQKQAAMCFNLCFKIGLYIGLFVKDISRIFRDMNRGKRECHLSETMRNGLSANNSFRMFTKTSSAFQLHTIIKTFYS